VCVNFNVRLTGVQLHYDWDMITVPQLSSITPASTGHTAILTTLLTTSD